MPTHLGDTSKEGNDIHGRRRRQLRPKTSRIFIRTVAHLSPLSTDKTNRSGSHRRCRNTSPSWPKPSRNTGPSHSREHADQTPAPARSKDKHHQLQSTLQLPRRQDPPAPLAWAGHTTPGSQPSRCSPGTRTRENQRASPPARERTHHHGAPSASSCAELRPDPDRAATSNPRHRLPRATPASTGSAPHAPATAATPGRRTRPPFLAEIRSRQGTPRCDLRHTPAPEEDRRTTPPRDRAPPPPVLSAVRRLTGTASRCDARKTTLPVRRRHVRACRSRPPPLTAGRRHHRRRRPGSH